MLLQDFRKWTSTTTAGPQPPALPAFTNLTRPPSAFAQGKAKDFWKPPSRFEMKPMAKTITFRIVNLSVAMPTLAKTCKSVQIPEIRTALNPLISGKI